MPVKILFFALRPIRTRHFESVMLALAERGHTVTVATLPGRSGPLQLPDGLSHPHLSVLACPEDRSDRWRDLVKPLRIARDYTRYLDPRFADARRVRMRAELEAARWASGFKRLCERNPWARRRWRLLARALALAEDLVPSDRAFEAFIRSQRPDLVLITPLIDFGSHQTDYVKAAHRLGLPIAFLPYSWDNLTVKGLVRVIPDRVLVWNETQKREAIELHGVPPDRIAVTGAPRFDDFFALRPSTTRDEYCARIGLDPTRPFILYLCSGRFVTNRHESDFIRRWIGEVRNSADPALRTCGVLVRPHPAVPDEWHRAPLADLPDVAVSGAAKTNTDPGLYDALHHSAAVAGLNTSAMIQAGIVGKPVYTILTPEFVGQEGNLHFAYLLRENGGLVSTARDFDEHRRHLAAALAAGEADRRQTDRFLEAFARPYGLEVPATPITVREIERLAELRKRPARTPPWHYPVRWALRTWLRGRVTPRTADPPAVASAPATNGAAPKSRLASGGLPKADPVAEPAREVAS